MPEEKKLTRQKISRRPKAATKKTITQTVKKPAARPTRIISSKRAPRKKPAVVIKKVPVLVPPPAPRVTKTITPPATPLLVPSVMPTPIKPIPHRWSLRHNLVVVATLTIVGMLSFLVVAGHAYATFQVIESYGLSSASTLKPAVTTQRSFSTNAGQLTLRFPERWTVTETSAETIKWQFTPQPLYQITSRMYLNETANIFSWLQAHQPTYRQAQVVAAPDSVSALRGILIEAKQADGAPLLVLYFTHQKNSTEQYVIELTLTMPLDDDREKDARSDFFTFIKHLRLETN